MNTADRSRAEAAAAVAVAASPSANSSNERKFRDATLLFFWKPIREVHQRFKNIFAHGDGDLETDNDTPSCDAASLQTDAQPQSFQAAEQQQQQSSTHETFVVGDNNNNNHNNNNNNHNNNNNNNNNVDNACCDQVNSRCSVIPTPQEIALDDEFHDTCEKCEDDEFHDTSDLEKCAPSYNHEERINKVVVSKRGARKEALSNDGEKNMETISNQKDSMAAALSNWEESIEAPLDQDENIEALSNHGENIEAISNHEDRMGAALSNWEESIEVPLDQDENIEALSDHEDNVEALPSHENSFEVVRNPDSTSICRKLLETFELSKALRNREFTNEAPHGKFSLYCGDLLDISQQIAEINILRFECNPVGKPPLKLSSYTRRKQLRKIVAAGVHIAGKLLELIPSLAASSNLEPPDIFLSKPGEEESFYILLLLRELRSANSSTQLTIFHDRTTLRESNSADPAFEMFYKVLTAKVVLAVFTYHSVQKAWPIAELLCGLARVAKLKRGNPPQEEHEQDASNTRQRNNPLFVDAMPGQTWIQAAHGGQYRKEKGWGDDIKLLLPLGSWPQMFTMNTSNVEEHLKEITQKVLGASENQPNTSDYKSFFLCLLGIIAQPYMPYAYSVVGVLSLVLFFLDTTSVSWVVLLACFFPFFSIIVWKYCTWKEHTEDNITGGEEQDEEQDEEQEVNQQIQKERGEDLGLDENLSLAIMNSMERQTH